MKEFKRYKDLILVVAVLFIGLGWYFSQDRTVNEITTSDIEHIQQHSQARLELSKEALKTLEEIEDTVCTSSGWKTGIESLYSFTDKGVYAFVYLDDSIKFWTSNNVPIESTQVGRIITKSVVQLNNGWYYVASKQKENKTLLVLTLIKHQYPYENKYISNTFHESYKVPGSFELTPGEKSQLTVRLTESDVFTISKVDVDDEKYNKRYFLSIIIAVGFLLLLIYLHTLFLVLSGRFPWYFVLPVYVFIIFGLRYISLNQGFPVVFTDFKLFDPFLFGASRTFPSLGDFLINALILLYVCWLVFQQITEQRRRVILSKKLGPFLLIFFFIMAFFSGKFISGMFQKLIEDSNIYFSTNNLFDLSFYSILGIFTIGILLFAYYLFIRAFIIVIAKTKVEENHYYFWFFILASLYIVYCHIVNYVDLILALWPVVFVLVVSIYSRSNNKKYRFSFIVSMLFLMAFFSSHMLSKYTQIKEKKDRKTLAEKLATDEDPETEYLFALMREELLNEKVVQKAFGNPSAYDEVFVVSVLKKKYFNNNWDKYEIGYHLFGTDSLPLSTTLSTPGKSFNKLNEIVIEDGESSGVEGLYYVHNSKEKLSYIIKLDYPETDTSYQGHLFVELKSKKIPEDIGFPELLINKQTKTLNELQRYSYARFVNGVLVNRLGEYEYSVYSKKYEGIAGNNQFYYFAKNGFSHLVYQLYDEDRTLIVLSRVNESFIGKLTTFSYLFALFSILLLLFIFVDNIIKGVQIMHLSLSSKIQLLLIGVVLTTLILFVIGTRYYIENEYKEKNENLIREKIASVHTEVSHKLGSQETFGPDLKPYMEYILNKFAKVFFTDINLYSTNGELLASSRPQLFDEGIISKHMNPEAYQQMGSMNKNEFIHEEKIGNLTYLSAYVPFFNEEGKLMAYLNLPYFAKQNELESEIADFIVAIVNIFIVLLAVIVLAALFVTNWLTRPLQMLQASLAKVEFGKTNQPLPYRGSDEIAELVKEYNKKVAELELKANQLAKTERESAWREMAKQVAHEIKNPLTPMKLSVQHLERTFDPEDADFQNKLTRFSDNLIKQIDALTHIANEFSNFAKMPLPNAEKINLIDIINAAVELHKENTEGVSIAFEAGEGQKVIVKADRDQLLRVFNNIIKNAIQAIPDERKGEISIEISTHEEKVDIAISDNGKGISEEERTKIFVPNFTTKSTGMGLGLAMVKNIIETSGGSIHFESEEGEGTTFYISLPLNQDEE